MRQQHICTRGYLTTRAGQTGGCNALRSLEKTLSPSAPPISGVTPFPPSARQAPPAVEPRGITLRLRVTPGIEQGSRPPVSSLPRGRAEGGRREAPCRGRLRRRWGVKARRSARRPHARVALPCPGSPGGRAPRQAALP